MTFKRTAAIAVATAGAMLISVPAALAYPSHAGTFTDDDGNVHEASIEAIFDENVTDGCNPPDNDEYCPDSSITRGQMAKFLDRALNLDPATDDYFTDDDDSVFEDHINRLREAGITDGCNPPDNDEFCPEDFITREQMAKFLDLGFEVPDSDENAFDDDDDSIFEDHINAIAADGIAKGCNPPENDEFCPLEDVTRAQMASFMARAMEISHEDPTPFGNETCDPAYLPCVPTVEEMGDLDCSEILQHYSDGVLNDIVEFKDPHQINGDGDDEACEVGDPARVT